MLYDFTRGRLFLLGAIMGVMTMPNLYLRDGGADAKDLKDFLVGFGES